MSIIQRITPEATPYETQNRFEATFNAAGTGVYDFAFNAGQQGALVLELNQNYVYLIDRISFAVTAPEGVYLEAINTLPTFRLRFRRDNLIAFANPIPATKYHDGLEFSFWTYTDKKNDALVLDMQGVLNQVVDLIGIPQVFATLSMVVYQENNSQMVRAIKDSTKRGAGVKFYQDVA